MPALYRLVQLLVGLKISKSGQICTWKFEEMELAQEGYAQRWFLTGGVLFYGGGSIVFLIERMIPQAPIISQGEGSVGGNCSGIR